MSGKVSNFTICLTTALILISNVLSFAQTDLNYQDRGNRYEGVRPQPISGYDIELISARADYQDKDSLGADSLKFKLYLQQKSDVYQTVRELDCKYYYWLDKARPAKPWQPGFGNIFEWKTQDVIQHLQDIKTHDLGIVARLAREEPGAVERVAPGILYTSHPPKTIQGYLFTFKTRANARLTCSFYKEGESAAVYTQQFPRQPGGRPFTVRWNSSGAAEGPYRLIIRGYCLDTNDPLAQEIIFYHRLIVD